MYQKILFYLIILQNLDAFRLKIWFPVGLYVILVCARHQCGPDQCKKRFLYAFLTLTTDMVSATQFLLAHVAVSLNKQ